MLGTDFWGDLDIDVVELQISVDEAAKELVDHYGKELTEGDLLKLKGYGDTDANPLEKAVALAALKYYTSNVEQYNPKFIHQHNTVIKKKWWQFWKKR